MRRRVLFLVLLLAVSLVFSATAEVSSLTLPKAEKHNFLQEMDITFWQTVPFAAFWGYVVALQLNGGGGISWWPVIPAVLAVSLGNAYIHARQVVAEDKP